MNKINYNDIMERVFKFEEITMKDLKFTIDMKNTLNGKIYEDTYLIKHQLAFVDIIIDSLNIQSILYNAILKKNNELINHLLLRIYKKLLDAIEIMDEMNSMNMFNIRIYFMMLKKFEYLQNDIKDLCELIKIIK